MSRPAPWDLFVLGGPAALAGAGVTVRLGRGRFLGEGVADLDCEQIRCSQAATGCSDR